MADRAKKMSVKRKAVADGVFYAEIHEFFARELAEVGYAGVEVKNSPAKTTIIIRVTRPDEVLGPQGRRIRELTTLLEQRFNFRENTLELYAERVVNRSLCVEAQAESLKFKLLGGLAVRRAATGIIRGVMENGAKGCEVIVSGKLRGQRAKGMKFRQGFMIKSGHSRELYVRTAVRHVVMRQGVIGVKVMIMLPHDPTGRDGIATPVADVVEVRDPSTFAKPTGAVEMRAAPVSMPGAAAPVVPMAGADMAGPSDVPAAGGEF